MQHIIKAQQKEARAHSGFPIKFHPDYDLVVRTETVNQLISQTVERTVEEVVEIAKKMIDIEENECNASQKTINRSEAYKLGLLEIIQSFQDQVSNKQV